MLDTRTFLRHAAAAVGVIILAFAVSASAGDILDDWAAVKNPAPPELKPVKVDGATTALLVLDMSKGGTCGQRPRCAATVPNVKRLLDAARGAGAMVWYSLGKPEDAM